MASSVCVALQRESNIRRIPYSNKRTLRFFQQRETWRTDEAEELNQSAENLQGKNMLKEEYSQSGD